MQCREVRSQFTDYVSETLEEPGYSQIRQHLLDCASCCAEAEELKTIWTNLGSIPSAAPGPELRARFDVMLDAYKQVTETAGGYQVSDAKRVATLNIGGSGTTSCSFIVGYPN